MLMSSMVHCHLQPQPLGSGFGLGFRFGLLRPGFVPYGQLTYSEGRLTRKITQAEPEPEPEPEPELYGQVVFFGRLLTLL